MTGAASALSTSHSAAKKPLTGPQLLISIPIGVKPNSVRKKPAIGITTGAICCHSRAKNAEIGFQLATIKPAANATPAAKRPIGEASSVSTALKPAAAVVTTVNATAAAASPSTSCG